ncbi:unnamed protein product [Gadus morhua 'NCC']
MSAASLLQSFGSSAMLGPVVMPMDVAMRFYIANSPPPLRGLLASSYEELQRGFRARAPPGPCPLRPCLGAPPRGPQGGKKRVVFADSQGHALTAVHVFSDRGAGAAEDLMFQMSDLETVTVETKEPAGRGLELDFPPPAADYLALRARLRRDGVCLESVALQRCVLSGTVRVRNLGFNKAVVLRLTLDGWASHQDTPCTFINSLYGGPDSDTFAFALDLPAAAGGGDRGQVQFCVCFRVEGQEFWDNNDGRNYGLRPSGREEERGSPAPPPTAADPRRPPDPRGPGGGLALMDLDLDQFGSPRTSSGLFPRWQSWGTAEGSTPYW